MRRVSCAQQQLASWYAGILPSRQGYVWVLLRQGSLGKGTRETGGGGGGVPKVVGQISSAWLLTARCKQQPQACYSCCTKAPLENFVYTEHAEGSTSHHVSVALAGCRGSSHACTVAKKMLALLQYMNCI